MINPTLMFVIKYNGMYQMASNSEEPTVQMVNNARKWLYVITEQMNLEWEI